MVVGTVTAPAAEVDAVAVVVAATSPEPVVSRLSHGPQFVYGRHVVARSPDRATHSTLSPSPTAKPGDLQSLE